MASEESDEGMEGIPKGYRFSPTDDELIESYLMKKVKGEPLPCEAVTDCEIYGDNDKEPWKIFGETSSEKFYIFTKLKKKGKGRRIDRIAGCGTWKGQRTDPVKDSQNNHIGFRKLFVFEVKGSNNVSKGHWLMHEFSLLNDESGYVLCAIRNKGGIDNVDDQQPKKRVRFSNSTEEEESNSFVRAATPVSTSFVQAATPVSTSFVQAATPVSTSFFRAAKPVSTSFVRAGTPVSTLASDEALG